MTQSVELSLALTTVAATVVVATRTTSAPMQAVAAPEPRRVLFASGIIRKRRGERLRWS